MADIKIAGRIKAGAADGISGYASEILFDDAASNKTVKEKIEEVASSPQTMIVTISSDGNYTADKTFAEIAAFIDNGGTVIAKDEEDGDSYYYLDNYIASEVVFTRNIWGSGGFSTRCYTIDNTNTVSFIDSVHHISSDVNSSSTANLANSAAVKALRDSMSEIKSISVNNVEQQYDQEGNVDIAVPTSLAGLTDDTTHRTVTDAEKSTWNGKQDALTFDNAPTANSSNPVKSGGVYQAIQDIDVSSQISGKEDKSNKVTSFSSPTDTQYPSAKLVSDQLATKQGTISDLSTIRSNAAAGATAVQPSAMNTALAAKQDTLTFDNAPTANSNNPVKSSGIKTALDAKQDTISDLATIRSGATAGSTAYQKPGTGIPSTDLASAVQTSLGKADTAIQSVTVGTTTTGAAGTNASVVNGGTATAPVLNFTIPQGAQGVKGDTVIMGGESSYTLYNTTGDAVDGAMTQQAVTRELTELSGEVEVLDTAKKEYENGGVEIDLTSGTTLNKQIYYAYWSTGSYSSFIDMTEYAGQEISITTNATYGINYAFTSSAAIGNNNSVVTNIVSGRAIEMISVGTTVTDIVPAGTSYLCLRRSSTASQTDTDMLPASVMIGGTAIDVSGGIILKARMTFPTWTTGGNRRCSIIPLPYGGRTIEITANDTYKCTYAFFSDGTTGSNNAAVTNFAKNSMTSDIGAGNTVIKEIPANATHLYLYRAASSFTTDTTYMPKKVFVRNALKVNADSVRYSDYYNKDSNVQTVLESVDIDVRGVEVLDKSTFTVSGDDIVSPGLLLYKEDTVTINGSVSSSSHIPITRWYNNFTTTLVPYTSGATSYTYTAIEDMYVQLTAVSTATFTISRANKRIDNIEKACHDIPNKLYLAEMLGNARKPDYSITRAKYINGTPIIKDGANCFYSTPVELKAGETIHLYCGYNGWSISHLTISDAEGNLISIVGKKVTNNHYTYRATADCYIMASGYGIPNPTVIIVGSSKIQDYMDDYDKQKNGTDIMTLWGTNETLLKLRQLNRPFNDHNTSEGPASKRKGAYNPWIIIHFSDIHNDSTNLRRIETFAEYYKQQTDHLDTNDVLIDDVLDTGDNVFATAGGAIPWNTNNIAATFLNTIGNHDIEGMGNLTVDGVTGWPAVYKRQIGPFRSQWGNVVFPSENVEEEGKCYYYKDYTSQNIRLIVLMNWANTTTTYMNNEYTWFESVLNDALTNNLTVVCAGHVKPGNLTPIEGCPFHTHEYGYETQDNASQFVILVDKFIRAGGAFACWLAGHTHYDLTGWVNSKYTENGIEYIVNNQLCVVVENAGGQNSEYERRYWNSDTRIAGTKSQDCFNIVCVNAAYYRVSVMRIGSQYDNSGQHKGGFCIDYKNKRMLSCY